MILNEVFIKGRGYDFEVCVVVCIRMWLMSYNCIINAEKDNNIILFIEVGCVDR